MCSSSAATPDPPFAGRCPRSISSIKDYRDRAAFYVVYIQEAHPIDAWQVSDNLKDDVLVRPLGQTTNAIRPRTSVGPNLESSCPRFSTNRTTSSSAPTPPGLIVSTWSTTTGGLSSRARPVLSDSNRPTWNTLKTLFQHDFGRLVTPASRALLYGTLPLASWTVSTRSCSSGSAACNPSRVSGHRVRSARPPGLCRRPVDRRVRCRAALLHRLSHRRRLCPREPAHPRARARPILSGVLYGLGVYLVMNTIVVPLSAVGRRSSWPVVVNGVLIHLLGVGLPASLVARAAARNP